MFQLDKLIQATGYVLKRNSFKMNYLKVIKILYLADRESIICTGQSMSGDSFVNMKNGPVLSRLYDLIKNRHTKAETQNFWNTRFSTDGYDLIANFDRIPEGGLSTFEKETLTRLDDQFKEASYGEMIDYVHKACPEWEDTDTSKPIHLERILECAGMSPDEIDIILAENEAFDKEEGVFTSIGA
ncbi:hypothetical protein FACS1894141_5860 [Spirochaetia bacterium]|nr:hypothetical protein FACS1894141_5860 [Spirochaetia bacterium]